MMDGTIMSGVRVASTEDIPIMVEWGARFHAAGGLKMPYSPEKVADLLDGLIAGGGVFISSTGMIGGALVSPYCTDDWKMAVELFWWADGGGMALLRAFEDWARSNGADEIRMTSLGVLERATQILARKGYTVIEISHTKVV